MIDRLDPPEVQGLVEDLGGGQVPAEPHLPGRAEPAPQRATRLRREAQRAPAVAVPHQHRFDRMTVMGSENDFHGAVACLLLPLLRQRRERHGPVELAAQPHGEIRHLSVSRGPARGPLPHLRGAIRRLSARGQPVSK